MSAQRPNVVVFFTDQQRWDTTSIHGNPMGLTPNFDRLAQRGTNVYHSFTCQPVCGPARACLQTGLYATETGCYRNSITLPTNQPTLAHYFNEAGYQTAYIGKWHLVAEETTIGPVPKALRGGYDYWLASNVLELTSLAYDTVVYDNDDKAVKLPGYRTDALTDAAIRYIDTHKDNPFFLFLSHIEPHHQNQYDDFPAPDGYEERYRGGWVPPDLAALGGSTYRHLPGYYGMVKRLDEALGRLLDALKSMNLLDTTVILFTSDHGNHFRTRNHAYKRSCHDSSIRVPTALQGPGFNGGGHVQNLVSLIDLPPTLLDAAGIPIPGHMQGKSLLRLLRGEMDEWPEEVFAQISEAQVGRMVRTKRWKYAVSAPDANGLLDADSDTYQEEFLYDLKADPYELNNLIGFESHEEVTRVMRERLVRCMTAANEKAPNIKPAKTRHALQKNVLPEEIYT